MKETEILVGALAKMLKKDETEVKGLVYNGEEVIETAIENVLNADAERIKRLQKEYETNGFNNGVKKATGEVLTDFEDKLRIKYGVKSDVKGIDLVDFIVQQNQKTAVNTEDVRKHPAYLELERSTVHKDEYNKVIGEFENYKLNLERQKVMNKVQTKALDLLEKMNPVIEDNPVVAKRRKEMFLNEFSEYDYEFEGDYTMVLKDGKRIQDRHGNPIGFDTYVREVAERNFVLSQQQYRQSSGNSNNKNGNFMVTVPRTPEEYHKAIVNEKDPAKRIAIKQAYEAANK
jgi:hypothetical protein